MKKLWLVGGTMGVGKTTTCRILRDMLPNCAFLDGDWCWDMHPFIVNDETKAMVMGNICHVINSFLGCSVYENVVFCWVMHEQAIIDEILSRLEGEYEVRCVSLMCSAERLEERMRMRNDMDFDRSVSRLPMYEKLNTVKIDTSEITAAEAAERIKNLQ